MKIVTITAFLLLGSSILIAAREVAIQHYWKQMSATDKCILDAKVNVMHESVMSERFYQDEPALTRLCAVINESK